MNYKTRYSSWKLIHFYGRAAHRGYLSFLSLDPTLPADPIWVLTAAQVSFYMDLDRGIERTKSTGNQRERSIEKVEQRRPCHVGQDDQIRNEEKVVKTVKKG
jgi:hypothetical protein